jgi:GTP-binding protein YchF
MDLAIIGLDRSGRTTIFNALTHGHAATGTYGSDTELHIGVMHVPDERLDRLGEAFEPKKVTHNDIRYLDFPGALRGFGRGEGPSSEFLGALANADAIVHVVRAFRAETVPHPEGSVDPDRDVAAMDLELAFADLTLVQKRLDKLDIEVRSARAGERDAGEKEMALLQRMKQELEKDVPVRAQSLSEEELRSLVHYQFLTAKPLLLVLNIDEADVGKAGELEADARSRWAGPGRDAIALCGELEMELAELSDEEAAEFRGEMGLEGPGPERVARASQDLLGLVTFFTVNPEDAHAWAVPRATPAITAAGKVHSDMERGFIRAEVLSWQQLLDCAEPGVSVSHAMAEAKKQGILRTEGKSYEVQDGDVVHVLFNV